MMPTDETPRSGLHLGKCCGLKAKNWPGSDGTGSRASHRAGPVCYGRLRHWHNPLCRPVALGVAALLCLTAAGANFRWASSSNRIYVDGPGSVTLTDLKAALPAAPLTQVAGSNLVWYLAADLIIEQGAQHAT